MTFKNIAEVWTLYDSVLVTEYNINQSIQQPGWFTTFAEAGAAQNFSFFNVRNRQAGLSFNNQDTRDALAFPLVIYGMGVQFFSPAMKSLMLPGGVDTIEQHVSHLWEVELPRHVSVELQIQQDIKVETTSLMVPPGYGPVGGAVGNGVFNDFTGPCPAFQTQINSQSNTHINNRYKFPKPIQVPRRANVSAVLRLSEYASQLLQTFPQGQRVFQSSSGIDQQGAVFGICVSLTGQRQVQQRGQYHA